MRARVFVCVCMCVCVCVCVCVWQKPSETFFSSRPLHTYFITTIKKITHTDKHMHINRHEHAPTLGANSLGTVLRAHGPSDFQGPTVLGVNSQRTNGLGKWSWANGPRANSPWAKGHRPPFAVAFPLQGELPVHNKLQSSALTFLIVQGV